jgi:hypothetical protein
VDTTHELGWRVGKGLGWYVRVCVCVCWGGDDRIVAQGHDRIVALLTISQPAAVLAKWAALRRLQDGTAPKGALQLNPYLKRCTCVATAWL